MVSQSTLNGVKYFDFRITNNYPTDKNFTAKAEHIVTDSLGNKSVDFTIAGQVKVAPSVPPNQPYADYLLTIKPSAPNGDYKFTLTVDVDGNNVCKPLYARDLTVIGQDESAPIDSTLTKIENPANKYSSVGDIITALVPNIFALAGLIAFVFLSWGGVRYALSRGDAKAADSARQTITNSIIGLVIILAVFAIFEIITAVFKISLFSYLPLHSAAAPAPHSVDIGCAVKLGSECIKIVFPSIASLVTAIVAAIDSLMGLIFFALLVWGGIRYMLARGDEKATQAARGVLTNAVTGLLIVISAFAIITLIGLFTGQSSLLP